MKWTTATETNNQGFEVQRGTSNSDFVNIGFVEGNGTPTEPNSYTFKDRNVSTGTFLYRLKQIDLNGNYEYSNVVEVTVDFSPTEFMLSQNYPNPFNPSTTIEYSIPERTDVNLTVVNIVGEEVATLVNQTMDAGNYSVVFDSHSGKVRNLPSGVYFYTLQAGNFVTSKKMILLK